MKTTPIVSEDGSGNAVTEIPPGVDTPTDANDRSYEAVHGSLHALTEPGGILDLTLTKEHEERVEQLLSQTVDNGERKRAYDTAIIRSRVLLWIIHPLLSLLQVARGEQAPDKDSDIESEFYYDYWGTARRFTGGAFNFKIISALLDLINMIEIPDFRLRKWKRNSFSFRTLGIYRHILIDIHAILEPIWGRVQKMPKMANDAVEGAVHEYTMAYNELCHLLDAELTELQTFGNTSVEARVNLWEYLRTGLPKDMWGVVNGTRIFMRHELSRIQNYPYAGYFQITGTYMPKPIALPEPKRRRRENRFWKVAARAHNIREPRGKPEPQLTAIQKLLVATRAELTLIAKAKGMVETGLIRLEKTGRVARRLSTKVLREKVIQDWMPGKKGKSWHIANSPEISKATISAHRQNLALHLHRHGSTATSRRDNYFKYHMMKLMEIIEQIMKGERPEVEGFKHPVWPIRLAKYNRRWDRARRYFHDFIQHRPRQQKDPSQARKGKITSFHRKYMDLDMGISTPDNLLDWDSITGRKPLKVASEKPKGRMSRLQLTVYGRPQPAPRDPATRTPKVHRGQEDCGDLEYAEEFIRRIREEPDTTNIADDDILRQLIATYGIEPAIERLAGHGITVTDEQIERLSSQTAEGASELPPVVA